MEKLDFIVELRSLTQSVCDCLPVNMTVKDKEESNETWKVGKGPS